MPRFHSLDRRTLTPPAVECFLLWFAFRLIPVSASCRQHEVSANLPETGFNLIAARQAYSNNRAGMIHTLVWILGFVGVLVTGRLSMGLSDHEKRRPVCDVLFVVAACFTVAAFVWLLRDLPPRLES